MPTEEEVLKNHAEQLKRVFEELKGYTKNKKIYGILIGINKALTVVGGIVIILNVIALLLAIPSVGASLLAALIMNVIFLIAALLTIVIKLIELGWPDDPDKRLNELKIELEKKEIKIKAMKKVIEDQEDVPSDQNH